LKANLVADPVALVRERDVHVLITDVAAVDLRMANKARVRQKMAADRESRLAWN
jgi:hypothetical protein